MDEFFPYIVLTLVIIGLLLLFWRQRVQANAKEEFFATRERYRYSLTQLKNAAEKYPLELRTRADDAIERIDAKFALFMAISRQDITTDWRSALRSLKTLSFSAKGLHDIYEAEYKDYLKR